MQTQQVAGVFSGGAVYSASSVATKSGDGSFEQLIQMSQNTGAAQEQVQKPVETTKKEPVEKAQTAEQPEQSADVAKENADTSATTDERTELKQTKEAEAATDVEAVERVAGVLAQVTEVIQEVLGLTEEQLNMFMEELGIVATDLLQPETLQNLVLMANSEQDAVILLTDAELLATVNELTEQVEQVLAAAGVTVEELAQTMENPEFDALVADAMKQLENSSETEETNESTNVEPTEITKTSHSEEVNTVHQTEEKETGTFDREKNSEEFSGDDRFTQQFVQNLQQVADKVSEVTGQKDFIQMVREIADQILEKVKVSVTAETTSLEIVLTPEELGRVNLTVSAEQDGMMKARFVTENELAREAIERNLVQFKEMLQEQGLKVDTIEVTVGNFEFDKNGQTNENPQEDKRNGNRSFMTEEELNQKDETDTLARVFMEGGESTVNYMA